MYLDGEVTHTYVFAAQVHDSTIAIFCFLKNEGFFSKSVVVILELCIDVIW